MKKKLIVFVGFIILLAQSAFSQYDSIVASGACIDTSRIGSTAYYIGDSTGKPMYKLRINCYGDTTEALCDQAGLSGLIPSSYTVCWTGNRWEWLASPDYACIWLVQVCFPNDSGDTSPQKLYMVNYENSPLPPAFGWQIIDPGGCTPYLLGGYSCNIHQQKVNGDTTYCTPGSHTISVDSTQEGVNYFLCNHNNNAVVDGPVAGTGSAISFTTGVISNSNTYYIYASSIRDSLHCHLTLTDTVVITKKSVQNSSITSTICYGDSVKVGTHIYKTTGTYTDTLTTVNGCDSIVNLNLTVENSINTTTNVSGNTITANATGATYQWIDCNNSNQPISGQTNQTYTATTNGNYAVIVTQNSCSGTSACVSITTTGVKNIASVNGNITVYPNPSSGIFNVQGLNKDNKIEIYNTLGVIIKCLYADAPEIKIDLSGEANGMYMLRISDTQIVKLNKQL